MGEFKKLQKNQVPLTPEERAEVMKRKAVWNFSGGSPSPAVWKSVDKKTGKATYVTHTHRAYNTASTLKGAIGRFHSFIKSTAGEVDNSMEKIAMYTEHIEKIAGRKKGSKDKGQRKKRDPYAMTKLVGTTNLIGIPGDMAFDYVVEGMDIFRKRNKMRVGNNPFKALTTPSARRRFKSFTSREGFTALPLSAAVAAGMTLPVFIAEYKADHKNKQASELIDEMFIEKAAKYEVGSTIEWEKLVGGENHKGVIVENDGDTVYVKDEDGKVHPVDIGNEKTAAENDNFFYHASPVQDIKKFRLGKDTSGNNKGEVVFATKEPEFASAFGTRWNDGTARLSIETSNKNVPTVKNMNNVVLYYTDKVNLDKPCSMYKLKGNFKELRYKGDVEFYTNDIPEIVSEEKFNSFKDMAKFYGLELKKAADSTILQRLREKKSTNFEKTAAENENDFNKNGKIPVLERAFQGDPIAKKVAYMIATSHEYKKPNIKAALMFTKNYTWELSKCKLNDLQGINKPVDEKKVEDMAKNMKRVDPFVVVNQLDAIRPQTPGKKILIDGHHRCEACKKKGMEEVPVYKGIYTGGAGKTLDELKEKTALEVVDYAFEKIAAENNKKKVYAVDFDGTIVTNKFPEIGEPIEKTINFIKKKKKEGHTVIIWTCRTGEYLDKAKKFLDDNEIPYDDINENSNADFESRKIFADYYIDDRAINVDDLEKIASHKDKTEYYTNKIRKAGIKQKMVSINYVDRKGNGSERVVEPYKIDGDSFWAYDVNKEGIRRFKLPQLGRVQITNQGYSPRWPIEVGEYTPQKKRTKPSVTDNPGQLTLMDDPDLKRKVNPNEQ